MFAVPEQSHLTVIEIGINVFGCGAVGKLTTKNWIGQPFRFVLVQMAALLVPMAIETASRDRNPYTIFFNLPVLK